MLGTNSISNSELRLAYNQGILTIGNMVLDQKQKELYGIINSLCNNDKAARNCMYLYLYALGTWCNDADAINFMTEAQLQSIVLKIEELKQVCCDYSVDTCNLGDFELACEDDIPSTSGGNTVYQKEIVYFADVDTFDVVLSPIRITKYGEALNIEVEMLVDGTYRVQEVEIIPDAVPNTTKYTLNFGVLSTGRIKIS
jgi:hypothetical protein